MSENVIKLTKRGYSDYYCRWLFYSNVSFWLHFFTVLEIQLSSLLPQKQVYLGPADFLLGI